MAAGVKFRRASLYSGAVANRPSIVREGDYLGSFYLATDEDKLYYSDGDEWLELNTPEGTQISLDQLPATLAGDGLAGSDGEALEVVVDDSTIAIVTNELTVKDAGLAFVKSKVGLLTPHTIPLGQVRGPTGVVTTATPADGVWAELIASNVHGLTSNLADGGTKTAVGTVQFALPPNYKAAGGVKVAITCQLKSVTGTGVANNGSDLAVAAYEQSKTAGTVSSDIVASGSPATFAALDTVYVKLFVLTATDLVAGDMINLLITGRAIENDAGDGTLQVVIHNIDVQCDEYGAA